MKSAGALRRLLVLCVASAAVASPVERTRAAASTSLDATSPSKTYTATIARVGTDDSGFARYSLTWRGENDGGTSTISSEIQTIAKFFVLDDGRAVIVGGTSVARVSAFHAIALASAKTVVVNECFAPAASPNGRYIAYVRIHPQRRAAAGRASVARMSAEYRVTDLMQDGDVATTSYPIPLQQPSNPGHTHMLALPIAWENADHFHFGDRFDGKVSRVYVTLDAGGKPTVASIVDVNSGSPS